MFIAFREAAGSGTGGMEPATLYKPQGCVSFPPGKGVVLSRDIPG